MNLAHEAGFRSIWMNTHNKSVVYDLKPLCDNEVYPDFTTVGLFTLSSTYEYSIQTDIAFIATSL